MSSSWAKTQTTHGHGIFSQHRAEHWKEWVSKETRNQERSASPERVFNDQSSFHRSSLFVPIASEVSHLMDGWLNAVGSCMTVGTLALPS